MRHHTIVALVLGLLVGAAAASADDPPELRFEDGPRVLTTLEEALYVPQFLDGDHASETWDYSFWFPKTGHVLHVQFLITNLGGKHRGGAISWILPAEGEAVLIKNSRKRKEWQLDTAEPGMHMGVAKHRLDIDHPKHRVSIVHNRHGGFLIEAESTTAAVRQGRIDYEKGFVDVTTIAPRLRARGSLTRVGQEPLDLGEGFGVVTVTRTNMPERDRAMSLLRYDSFGKGPQVSVFELTTPDDLGFQRLATLLLVRGDQVELAPVGYHRTYLDLAKDKEEPHYPVPAGFTVGASAEPWSIDGTVQLELARRDEILDFVNSGVARFFAKLKLKANPVGYRFATTGELSLRSGEAVEAVDGRGLATLSIVKDPPATW